MSRRLEISLDDELYEALQAEAREKGASLAELVRRSVSDRLGVQSVGDRLAILDRTIGAWSSSSETGQQFQRQQRRGLAERSTAVYLVPVGDGCLSDPATGVHRVVVDTNVTDRAADFARTYRRSHAAIDAIDFLVAATAELHATSF